MPSFKLYYTPGSCGAANFITATLAEADFDSEQVDIRTKKTASGTDFTKVNPKGNVPTIVAPNGAMLNENVATLTYIADTNPEAGLAPPEGSPMRYQYLNAVSFVATEMHQSFGLLFNPALDDAAKKMMRERATMKVKMFTELFLAGKEYMLGGSSPTAADIYAYIVLSWAPYLGVDFSHNKEAHAFSERVAALPGVKSAHEKMNSAPKA